jgi:outer membrane protein
MKTNALPNLYIFKHFLLCSVFCFALSGNVLAQNHSITLDNCYEIGIKRAPELQKGLLDILGAEIMTNQTKMERLPTLSAMVNHGYNWGQSIDPFTNTFATERVQTNNLNMRSSWNLFAGFSVKYRIDLAKLNQEYTDLLYKVNVRNYKNDIATAYAKLQADHLRMQLNTELVARSEAFLTNIQALEKSGRNTPFDVLRFKAIYENDVAELALAKNEFEYTGFVIKQLLNIQSPDTTANSFVLLDEKKLKEYLKIPENLDVSALPETKIAEINQASATLRVKSNKALMYPSLSLSSAIGTGYSGANNELINGELVTKTYGVQFRENLYQSVVLTLSMPIFNHYTVRRDIALAKIQKRQADWDVIQTQIELKNTLERINFELTNERIALETLKVISETQDELFRASEKMFRSGIINFVEFVDARNNATQARLRYLSSLSRSYGLLLLLENFSALN